MCVHNEEDTTGTSLHNMCPGFPTLFIAKPGKLRKPPVRVKNYPSLYYRYLEHVLSGRNYKFISHDRNLNDFGPVLDSGWFMDNIDDQQIQTFVNKTYPHICVKSLSNRLEAALKQ